MANLRATVLFLLCCRAALPASPVVTKVEPPDWPAGPAGITLRILVTGENLAGCAVRGPFVPGKVLTSASGTHLFFDVTIPPNASPGPREFEIATPSGSAHASFWVVPALDSRGRFQGFSSDDVIYLLMPDRFANGDPSNDDPPQARGMTDRSLPRSYHGGDFAGIMRHLPYLKELGVTALWLTPIYDNTNRSRRGSTDYHGYGAVDYYAVEEHFGTLDEFRALVDRAHALGMKIIQDQVANHVGPDHPWAADPPTPTWFHGTTAQHSQNDFRIWTLIDPHATPQMRATTLDGWFANRLPDLNQADPEVERYLIQNTLWWIGRTGIDGIRQDTLPYAPRTFWSHWSAAIRRNYPSFDVVGEVFESDPALVSFFQAGATRFDGIDTGIDTLFDFPLENTVRRVFTGAAPARDLAISLAHDSLYPDPSRLVTFVGLHDLPRFLNDPKASPEILRQVFTFLFTVRGIPMVYYGDEIGMTGAADPDNRRDFPGGWAEDPANAFEAAGRTPEQETIRAHVALLGRLRAELEGLRRGSLLSLAADQRLYAFARVTPHDCEIVVLYTGAQPGKVRVPLEGTGVPEGATLHDALGQAPPAEVHGGTIEITLPAHGAAIYR
jgi:glycosidase